MLGLPGLQTRRREAGKGAGRSTGKPFFAGDIVSVETIAATAARICTATENDPQRSPAPQPEKLFTLEQIQKAGGFSRSTLYRLRHGGGLRTITIAGLVRVRERDWQAWLDKNATATPEGGDNV